MNYFQSVPFAVTVCDTEGRILDMNEKSVATFVKPGDSLIGASLFDCHPEPARTKLAEMLQEQTTNAYTIEKNGVKKIIYQAPWYKDGAFAGYVEMSMEIPFQMAHHVRLPKV